MCERNHCASADPCALSLTKVLCLQAAPHSQLIVTAQKPTGLLDIETLTWRMDDCKAEQAAAIMDHYEVP